MVSYCTVDPLPQSIVIGNSTLPKCQTQELVSVDSDLAYEKFVAP